MNFKRNCLVIIALVGATFAVAGCQDNTTFVRYEPIQEVVDDHKDYSFNDLYIKYGNYKNYVAKDGDGNTIDLGDTYNVLTTYTGRHIMQATGDKKILVVPVEFPDYTIANLGVSAEDYVSNLEKAFFGGVKNNKYVSVAEYYNRSSYGKLRISGKVCDKFYTFPKPVYDINMYKTNRQQVQQSYNDVLDWYKKNYGDSLDDYRIEATGEVPIYMVYTLPIELNTSNPNFFWAYTFSSTPLAWSSYSVMNTLAGYPDAHTFIHEVGHLFGLEDYYPTDENDASTAVPEPAGRIDMMDCSVGDHTALSKMMLNWARPYWVKDTCEIKIKALTDAGDLILINDKWNGSVFDEYYIIEFYTPLGLNYYDTNIGNNYAKLPTLPGVKIYHVDARLGYYALDTLGNQTTFKYYCGDEQKLADKIAPNAVNPNINIVHDNKTYPDAKAEDKYLKNYLYELQLNHVGHSVAGCASNLNLFRTGDEFDDFKFNKYINDYKVTVTGLTYRDATIKVEKTAKI